MVFHRLSSALVAVLVSLASAQLPPDVKSDLGEGVPAFKVRPDRKSTRLNSSHGYISYAVFCLKKKNRHPKPLHRLLYPPPRTQLPRHQVHRGSHSEQLHHHEPARLTGIKCRELMHCATTDCRHTLRMPTRAFTSI